MASALIQYRLSREYSEGLKLVVFEEYDNAEALKAHQAAPEFQALAKAAPELAASFDMNYLNQIYP